MTSIKFRALTHDDHKLFFEALGEHGKDFQNIQQYMAQKGSKNSNKTSNSLTSTAAAASSSSSAIASSSTNANNANSAPNQSNSISATTFASATEQNNCHQTASNTNISNYNSNASGNNGRTNSSSTNSNSTEQQQDKREEDKKREQIRNFYNKLYAKLSQLIGKLDDRVEKVNQELYLLINYGEIWKKHGFKFNNKTKKLLEELVYHGYTTLRFKNKNVRLRTPPCKALKKINEIGIDEKVKVVSARELPKDVIVEFHPATNRDWLKVQSLSQNPRVRAKLSIQKRLFSILEFLESKWNISQEKLNRTVDAWLKVPPLAATALTAINQTTNHTDDQQTCNQTNNTKCNFDNPNGHIATHLTNGNPEQQNSQVAPNNVTHLRIRLKPSALHELKEVNITRVVPDNHLDLSLTAYIKRLNESTLSKQSTASEQSPATNKANANCIKETNLLLQSAHHLNNEPMVLSEIQSEFSQGAMSNTNSRLLPVSLTTPDCSILFERSLTSDQPSIAQARRHLNLLQTLAGSFEGCENSRTACDDTQDRLLPDPILSGSDRSSGGFGGRSVTFADVTSSKPSTMISAPNMIVNNNIPALFDEDAAILPNIENGTSTLETSANVHAITPVISIHNNSDSQNSRSVDFNIPKNLTLGDWFKLASGQNSGGDDANHAFSEAKDNTEQKSEVKTVDETLKSDNDKINAENMIDEDHLDVKEDNKRKGSHSLQPHNHMIEIEKLAEGWTRQEEPAMTIGELYLAFKCPEKIVLEYEFEQFTYTEDNKDQTSKPISNGEQQINLQPINNAGQSSRLTIIPDTPSNDSLIFKLLTAASLSLAHIEQQKQELKLQQEQPTSKLKRRKGGSNNPNTMKYLTLHDIETTNQRVEEALKQLQPTRLSVYRRAR